MPTKHNRKLRPIIFLPDNPRIALVELTRDLFAVIDREDADTVGKYNWHAHWSSKPRSFYAQTNIRDQSGKWKILSLHQFLMGYREGMTIDHIDHTNTLDHRRCNLRHATRSAQNLNQGVRRNNKTGYKNIARKGNRWRVCGKGINCRVNIGYYVTLEEAIEAAKSPLLLANNPQGTQTPPFSPLPQSPKSSGTNVSTEPSRSSSAADSISLIHTAN